MFKKTQSVDSICSQLKSLIVDLDACQRSKETEAVEHADAVAVAEIKRQAALEEAKRASEVKFRIQALIGE